MDRGEKENVRRRVCKHDETNVKKHTWRIMQNNGICLRNFRPPGDELTLSDYFTSKINKKNILLNCFRQFRSLGSTGSILIHLYKRKDMIFLIVFLNLHTSSEYNYKFIPIDNNF
jgi:hypothetical protein